MLKRSPRTLERWRERHVGPPYWKLAPRVVVYCKNELEQWIAARRVEPERTAREARE